MEECVGRWEVVGVKGSADLQGNKVMLRGWFVGSRVGEAYRTYDLCFTKTITR